MSKIFKQKNNYTQPKVFRDGCVPREIVYLPGNPAEIVLSTGERKIASCLHCPDAPCLSFKDHELQNSAFPEFPQDQSAAVCATNAIAWDNENGIPVVDNNRCISCGICVDRCPVGAIYMIEEGIEINNNHIGDYLINLDEDDGDTSKIFGEKMYLLSEVKRSGKLKIETDEVITNIYNQLALIDLDAQFPNIFSRNLLMTLGTTCSIRRRGDVNVRMDAVLGPPGTNYGVMEVEFDSNALLDSPRNILDDLAVLSSRYGINYSDITPVIVSIAFPNTRSEYWRVINDINNVLQIKINSITIGALILLIWNLKKVNFNTDSFYADSECMEIRSSIANIIGDNPNISIGGILEVAK
ncbi:4Fe-4S binding protein [Brevibacillus brevis]|uniref:4Fe-4S binding protein n=1 Tax=Brevibacillus brevis TaxID=1393 RepID=A0ABY9T4C0_BREBE|nr:4Fe-4S binding protein [Brevibacillus brevis]WNC14354.1 4Fe-4S binding protein [Brevibacillus brevis]